MVERIIKALIGLVLIALVIGLVIWVLEFLGLALPLIVVRAIYVLGVLAAILFLWRTFQGDVRANL